MTRLTANIQATASADQVVVVDDLLGKWGRFRIKLRTGKWISEMQRLQITFPEPKTLNGFRDVIGSVFSIVISG